MVGNGGACGVVAMELQRWSTAMRLVELWQWSYNDGRQCYNSWSCGDGVAAMADNVTTMAGSVIAHRVAAMAYNVEACGAVAMVDSAKVCKTVTMELQ